jgi:hypothetical protein
MAVYLPVFDCWPVAIGHGKSDVLLALDGMTLSVVVLRYRKLYGG